MRISLLTGLALHGDDGAPLPLGERARRRRRLRGLLCVLALDDRSLTAAELRALLWDDPDRASALPTVVAQARDVLPEGRLATETDGGTRHYRLLRYATDTVDVDEFRAAVAAGDAAAERDRPAEAVDHYDRAVALWDDPTGRGALCDLPGTAPATVHRDRLLAARRHAAESYVAIRLDLGDHSPELAERVRHLLADDPLNETLHAHRVMTLHRLGRRDEALRAYRAAERALERAGRNAPGSPLRRTLTLVESGVPQRLPATMVGVRPTADAPRDTAAKSIAASGAERPLPSSGLTYRGVTDYVLGGKDNTAEERAFVDRIIAETGDDAGILPRENRAWMLRMIRELTALGIRQFLDLGSGLPDPHHDDLHRVARAAAGPDPIRVLYVDHDPVVAVTARALLVDGPDIAFHMLDLADADAVLAATAAHLDLTEPVALISANTLQYLGDPDDPDLGTARIAALLGRYLDALAPGSRLALSHVTSDGMDDRLRDVLDSRDPGAVLPHHLRSPEQIARLFRGLPLMDPGLTDVGAWRPEQPPVRRPVRLLAGVSEALP